MLKPDIYRSLAPFIRRNLKVKGITSHNGRGLYEFGFDCSSDELLNRLSNKLVTWEKQGIIEKIEDTDKYMAVKFKATHFNRTYRLFVINKRYEFASIRFTY